MSEEFKKVESLAEQLKAYVNTRLSQVKLSGAEKVSKLVAILIALLVVALVFFLFFVLISIAGAIAIGQWLGSMWLGFLIMAGIVLLSAFFIWLAKDRLIRFPIMNALIKIMFENDEDDK